MFLYDKTNKGSNREPTVDVWNYLSFSEYSLQLTKIQGQDSPSLKLYYLSLWLSLFQWKTLQVEKTVIVELGESMPWTLKCKCKYWHSFLLHTDWNCFVKSRLPKTPNNCILSSFTSCKMFLECAPGQKMRVRLLSWLLKLFCLPYCLTSFHFFVLCTHSTGWPTGAADFQYLQLTL